jgi:putative FmdB family regulatory protein
MLSESPPMPIYEYYCPDCHTVYSFFSARVDPDRRPDCPRCRRPELERKPSSFATLRHGGGEESEDPLDALDESRLEGAMDSLMREMEGVDEEDPRAMGKIMRRFGELSGLEMGDRMEELVRRLEAGEDPESLESEMEDLDDGDDPMGELFQLKKAVADRRTRRPKVDDELYFF